MSVITAPTTVPVPNTTATTTANVSRTSSLRRTTVVYGLALAAVATTATAATVHAAGVSLAVEGEMIPLLGFAEMTFLGAILGGLLLAVLNRRSTVPRHRFLQVTVALTALSCVPSLAWPDDAATKFALVVTHLVAAAIVVPALARHASR